MGAGWRRGWGWAAGELGSEGEGEADCVPQFSMGAGRGGDGTMVSGVSWPPRLPLLV